MINKKKHLLHFVLSYFDQSVKFRCDFLIVAHTHFKLTSSGTTLNTCFKSLSPSAYLLDALLENIYISF